MKESSCGCSLAHVSAIHLVYLVFFSDGLFSHANGREGGGGGGVHWRRRMVRLSLVCLLPYFEVHILCLINQAKLSTKQFKSPSWKEGGREGGALATTDGLILTRIPTTINVLCLIYQAKLQKTIKTARFVTTTVVRHGVLAPAEQSNSTPHRGEALLRVLCVVRVC